MVVAILLSLAEHTATSTPSIPTAPKRVAFQETNNSPQPIESAPSNLRDKVLSALEPEIRSHPDVIKGFRNRAERLKGKIILIGNESLLFPEDTFWEFADALLVKRDKNLATQKATQWVKIGGAILTDEHKYSEGLVKSVDGPFYRFICVESTLKGSKTNFWLSINNVSRRSPSDFALAINQYQKPFESETDTSSRPASGMLFGAYTTSAMVDSMVTK